MPPVIPFTNIRVVLCHTSHPGNIGAAARAMKTMGLEHLVLVAPRQFPSDAATAMASGATDVLATAKVATGLAEAIADCHWVVGASARPRHLSWPQQTPREMAQQVLALPDESLVALLFGSERNGLTNDELSRCDCHVTIPTNPEYGSLNLAAAVQVLCYELRATRVAEAADKLPKPANQSLATAGQLADLFQHWQQVLVDLDFLDPDNPRELMSKLRRLMARAEPDEREVNILRGMLSHTEKKLRKF